MKLTETQLSDKVIEFKKSRGNSVSDDSFRSFGIDENTNLTNYYWFKNRFSQAQLDNPTLKRKYPKIIYSRDDI